MTTLYDVPPDALIAKVAEQLRSDGNVNPPAWAAEVKTGTHNQFAPVQDGWWYTRCAAVLRKVAVNGPVGIMRLRTAYGGRKNRRDRPDRFAAGSGSILREALQQMEEETKAKAVYIVDSFGALYSETVHYLVEKFQMYIKTKEIGVHFHNNQQLAFANTVEGIIKGANFLDGTLYGLGRAAGNCPLELLLGFLKNPRYNLVPILDVIGKSIIPLREKIEWGYTIPYMLAGVLDRHPQTSMDWVEKGGPDKHDYVKFYNLISEDPEQ